MESMWNKDIKKYEFDELRGDIKTDILIIGGGMCGLMCAYILKNEGVDCVLAEADRICNGVTSNTTAKVTFQHGLIYDKIITEYGRETAKIYYESQKIALEKIKDICQVVDCDYTPRNSVVYSLDDKEKIENELDALERIGAKAEFLKTCELPFDIAGAVKIENQGEFHPLKFAYGISSGLKIYEKTKVVGLEKGVAKTNNGRIFAKKIIVATHFPFINKHGGYFIKMYQHRSYVLALDGAKNIRDMYVDEAKKGLSFRTYKNMLLLGGGSHRTGGNGGGWKELERCYKRYYPDAKESFRWATQDCMTLDGMPYIGKYSKNTPDLYVATGFNKWGMTSSMVSAIVLSDMICKGKSEFDKIYSPQRDIFHPQLAVNMFESIKGLITPTAPRCPHLGCALKYNKEEHSWDCPCHGSRFEENGKLINNPATDDKEM